MGQLLLLKTEFIKPSQDFLKKGTVDFILDCYKEGRLDALPPAPMVRRCSDNSNMYVAIDGHNLIAVNRFLGKECEVYLVSSAEDYLPNPDNRESIIQRNKDLADKYASSVREADKINMSFDDLIKKFIIQQI